MKKRMLLILFAIIIIVMIIFMISFTQRNYNPYDPASDNFVKNVSGVLNQGSNFLKYEDNLYFINEQTSSIIKYNIAENTSNPIVRMNDYGIGDKLYIISNKIIYTVGENTYYSNLDGTGTFKFANGNLVYINDDVYVYVVQESSAQHIYIASYDPETFMRTNDVFFNLANGYKFRYIKSIDDVLFFESKNTDNSLTLFSIDLKEYKSKIIAKKEIEKTNDYYETQFSDVAVDDDNLYFTVSSVEKTTDGESNIVNNDIYVQGLDYSVSEFFANEVEKRLFSVSNDNKEMIYEKYNEETKNYALYNSSNMLVSYKWEDIAYGDVSKYFTYSDSIIYKENEKFVALDSGYINYELKSVDYYDNNFYFMLATTSGSHVWFSCKKDGSELNKIYEWREIVK